MSDEYESNRTYFGDNLYLQVRDDFLYISIGHNEPSHELEIHYEVWPQFVKECDRLLAARREAMRGNSE